MRTLRKLKTTLTASFENFVNEVENQEAIINSMIADIKLARNHIAIQINMAKKNSNKLQSQKESISKEIQKWRIRAKEVNAENSDLAKDCVRKIIELDKELNITKTNQEETNKNIANLEKEKQLIEIKLNEIECKRRLLVSKETVQNTQNSIKSFNGKDDLDSIFNRWENKLIKNENVEINMELEEKDDLETFFENKELEVNIETELEKILKED